jgi:hypothetical protein
MQQPPSRTDRDWYFILSSGLDKRTADEQTAAQLLMAGRDDEERRIMNLP